MKNIAYLLALIATVSWTGAQAQSESQDPNEDQGHPYVGIGATSLGLDNDRVPGVPTSSPGHSSKIGSLILGYQFDDLWAADVSFGTDMSDNVDTDVFAVNGYLSQRRANAVKQKLVEDYDISPERLDTRGFGESRPIADNSTQAGREKNRRAMAVIMQTRTVTE